MTLACCAFDPLEMAPPAFRGDEASRWISPAGPGLSRIEFIVPQANCAACMPGIEGKLGAIPGVAGVRLNLTGRRVAVTWRTGEAEPQSFLDALTAAGYYARPFDPRETGLIGDDRTGQALLRALAVAGFAAANVMLLSVSVWSGASGVTRDLFHWVSAMIALPAVAYAGRPFFASALNALRHGSVNMDVPISLGVLLASAMSLFETINRAEHAYFDASVSLLFFLLAGRYLDHMMRARAKSAVSQLMTLNAEGATVVQAGGSRSWCAARDSNPGMTIAIAAGERLPADGEVIEGRSDIDLSMLTGEFALEPVKPGNQVHAGTLNVTGPMLIAVTAAGADTFLSGMIRLMAAAEQAQSRYMLLADRLARWYSPAVHLLAVSTLVAWLALGNGWHELLMAAIAVLIITCPCALGLAVPAVQVVTSGKLFRSGVMIKEGAALEKLALVDTVVFDKTGTLTRGAPRLVAPLLVPAEEFAIAAGLARESRHPLSRALLREALARGVVPSEIDGAAEHPGQGLVGRWRGEEVRLGSRAWCGIPDAAEDEGQLELAFKRGKRPGLTFTLEDALRPDAVETIARLKSEGLQVHVLSGDRQAAVDRVASAAGIASRIARATPAAKVAFLEALARSGRKVLMVGDGINDAPALAAGFTSMAPSSASDIGRSAAETVFMGHSLAAVALAQAAGVRSQRIARQNFALAIAYNVLAVPVAMAGLASPLVAAVAMSTSSIMVIANALRAGIGLRMPATASASVSQPATEAGAIMTRKAA